MKEHHCITNEEAMLSWFEKSRGKKVTSWGVICQRFCMMRDLKGVVDRLVRQGKLICQYIQSTVSKV